MTAITAVAPTDAAALDKLGKLFWLNELQPLRGLENLAEATQPEIGETAVDEAMLRSFVVSGIDRVEILAGRDFGCSSEKATILAMPVAGSVDGATLLEAVWSGYMLSLDATMRSGNNPRAHVGNDDDAIELATSMAARLGAAPTPSDEVYGSCGTYLEALAFGYDPASRTLSVEPLIGS